jgi:hypothetical protein
MTKDCIVRIGFDSKNNYLLILQKQQNLPLYFDFNLIDFYLPNKK